MQKVHNQVSEWRKSRFRGLETGAANFVEPPLIKTWIPTIIKANVKGTKAIPNI